MDMEFVTDLFIAGAISREDFEWMWGEHLHRIGDNAQREVEGTWCSMSRTRIGPA